MPQGRRAHMKYSKPTHSHPHYSLLHFTVNLKPEIVHESTVFVSYNLGYTVDITKMFDISIYKPGRMVWLATIWWKNCIFIMDCKFWRTLIYRAVFHIFDAFPNKIFKRCFFFNGENYLKFVLIWNYLHVVLMNFNVG